MSEGFIVFVILLITVIKYSAAGILLAALVFLAVAFATVIFANWRVLR